MIRSFRGLGGAAGSGEGAGIFPRAANDERPAHGRGRVDSMRVLGVVRVEPVVVVIDMNVDSRQRGHESADSASVIFVPSRYTDSRLSIRANDRVPRR